MTQVGHIRYHYLGGGTGVMKEHLVLSSPCSPMSLHTYMRWRCHMYLFIREGIGHVLVLGDQWHTSQES